MSPRTRRRTFALPPGEGGPRHGSEELRAPDRMRLPVVTCFFTQKRAPVGIKFAPLPPPATAQGWDPAADVNTLSSHPAASGRGRLWILSGFRENALPSSVGFFGLSCLGRQCVEGLNVVTWVTVPGSGKASGAPPSASGRQRR